MEPGEEECHDKQVIKRQPQHIFHLTIQVVSLVDVPEEVCDLNPIETCRYATKLVNRTRYPRYHSPHQVPHLSPAHECTLVPKEVTSTESARDKKVLDVETILIIAASKCHQVIVILFRALSTTGHWESATPFYSFSPNDTKCSL